MVSPNNASRWFALPNKRKSNTFIINPVKTRIFYLTRAARNKFIKHGPENGSPCFMQLSLHILWLIWFGLFWCQSVSRARYVILHLLMRFSNFSMWSWHVVHQGVIIQHHVATLLYLVFPYIYREDAWLMGACLIVEINTWLLIARRVFNKQGFTPWVSLIIFAHNHL